MKKFIAILLTVMGGLLANALLCMTGAFFCSIGIIQYVIFVLVFAFGFAVSLNIVTKKITEKCGLARNAVFLFAQAPIFVYVLANFIINLADNRSGGVGVFFKWGLIGLEPIGVAVCMLVTSVLTAAFVFGTAEVVKRKELL